jgi:uncharacterized protein
LPQRLKFRVLGEPLAVCRLAANADIPEWVEARKFHCVTRTADELSIVCTENNLPEDAIAERGWVALKLEGPFPFSMTGVLACFLQPLAQARIPIFAISTFDTDYVLLKQQALEPAVAALYVAGHEKIDKESL